MIELRRNLHESPVACYSPLREFGDGWKRFPNRVLHCQSCLSGCVSKPGRQRLPPHSRPPPLEPPSEARRGFRERATPKLRIEARQAPRDALLPESTPSPTFQRTPKTALAEYLFPGLSSPHSTHLRAPRSRCDIPAPRRSCCQNFGRRRTQEGLIRIQTGLVEESSEWGRRFYGIGIPRRYAGRSKCVSDFREPHSDRYPSRRGRQAVPGRPLCWHEELSKREDAIPSENGWEPVEFQKSSPRTDQKVAS